MKPPPSHVFGDNPDAADDRKTRGDAFRAKHRDVLQDNSNDS